MAIIFLENKYSTWYYKIINNAKNRMLVDTYVEKHHIVPRSLKGTDNDSNIVKLTAREHFVCHLLLTKMVSGYYQELMKFALGKFIQTAPGQQRIFTSWEYKKIREEISQARTGKKHSIETKLKMSEKAKGRIPWNKGMTGIEHSEESKLKRSQTLTGKSFNERFGECRAIEIKQKITNSKLGKPSGMLGKTHSEETKKKIKESNAIKLPATRKKLSEVRKGMKFSEEHLNNLKAANIKNAEKRKGVSLQKVECPHCGKIGGINLMKRYHNENCKNKDLGKLI